MKKLLLLLLMTNGICNAQMVLENSYPNSAQATGKKFLLMQIAPSDYKYFIFDPAISQFKLYNINHSLYSTVNVPVTHNYTSNNYNVCFVTKSLFDCDSTNLEYAIMNLGDGSPTFPAPYFAVYRTNGSLFQKVDSCRFQNFGQGMVYGPVWNHIPIINTQAGAKLILSHVNGDVKVYGLCDALPTNIVKNNNDPELNSLPYPNPSTFKITLPYKIPENEKNGFLIVYDLKGSIIKEFEVDNSFENIILSTNDFANGTYLYTLKTKTSEIKGSKFIISK